MPAKKPVSVLVLVHTPSLEVLLIERAAHRGFWQSVTGSQEGDEPLIETARRELAEETGIQASAHELRPWFIINRFEIMQLWRHRYADGITHNEEHVFSVQVPSRLSVTLAPAEHAAAIWLPWSGAAEKCFSWTNTDAILMLPLRNQLPT